MMTNWQTGSLKQIKKGRKLCLASKVGVDNDAFLTTKKCFTNLKNVIGQSWIKMGNSTNQIYVKSFISLAKIKGITCGAHLPLI